MGSAEVVISVGDSLMKNPEFFGTVRIRGAVKAWTPRSRASKRKSFDMMDYWVKVLKLLFDF
jgi:hypothetical protein